MREHTDSNFIQVLDEAVKDWYKVGMYKLWAEYDCEFVYGVRQRPPHLPLSSDTRDINSHSRSDGIDIPLPIPCDTVTEMVYLHV